MIIFQKRQWFVFIAILIFTISCLSVNVDEKGTTILDSIPVYKGAKFIRESRTTFPDSSPSIIRDYESAASAEDLMSYYQSTLAGQGWSLKVHNTSDPYVSREILAQKDNWRVSILIYSTGKFSLCLFLN